MKPATPEQSQSVDELALSFDRTVDRSLVHRAAVSEVFLTDIQLMANSVVRIGAQLPRSHAFFNDYEIQRKELDPFLLLEVCRQATLASAHTLGVAEDTILVSSNFKLELHDPAVFLDQRKPLDLEIRNTFKWSSIRLGRPRAGVCDQLVLFNNEVVASHSSSGQLLSRSQLADLRETQRGEPPPWTVSMPDRPDGIALEPAMLGRYNPLNVVLTKLEIAGHAYAANIAPPWQNRALFDHSYDHLTMQVLTEAARQLALITVFQSFRNDNHSWTIIALEGEFKRFAEIDLPVVVRADRGSISLDSEGNVKVEVEILQVGQPIAVISFCCADTAIGDNR